MEWNDDIYITESWCWLHHREWFGEGQELEIWNPVRRLLQWFGWEQIFSYCKKADWRKAIMTSPLSLLHIALTIYTFLPFIKRTPEATPFPIKTIFNWHPYVYFTLKVIPIMTLFQTPISLQEGSCLSLALF